MTNWDQHVGKRVKVTAHGPKYGAKHETPEFIGILANPSQLRVYETPGVEEHLTCMHEEFWSLVEDQV